MPEYTIILETVLTVSALNSEAAENRARDFTWQADDEDVSIESVFVVTRTDA